MGNTRDTGYLRNLVIYDGSGNITLPANLTVTGTITGYATTSYVGTQLGGYVPTTRTISINGTSLDLSANRSFTINSMVYPGAGIAVSTGTAWGTSLTDNSSNWNTAYGWGNHAGLYSLLNHTHTFASLTSIPTTLVGYGITDAATSAQGTSADTAYGWGNHASGGYVTLTGTQTISGVKTFSTYQLMDVAILIKHGSNTSTSGYTGIGSVASGLTINLGIGTTGSLLFNTSASYSYTFPAASGTLALTSDLSTYATQTYVGTQIANLVASSPAALDTLNELAAALGNDAAFSTTVSTALGNRLRVDINTQGLSATLQGYGRTNLGLGSLAVLSSIDNSYITDLAWSKLTGVPSTFTPSAHTHPISDIVGLQTALDGKEASITAGTTTQYWRGDKTWQTLPIYTLSGLGGVPTTRTITINGTAYDLSADRSWSIAAGVTSFNTRTGAITLTSGDVTGALGYTPYNATNPSGYITSSSLSSYLPLSGGTMTGILTFSSFTGNKIDFYYSGDDRYGIQVQSSELRIHSGAGGASTGGITFGKSTGSTFTEHLRIRNDGLIAVVNNLVIGSQQGYDNSGGWNKNILIDGTNHGRFRIKASNYTYGNIETYFWADSSVSPSHGIYGSNATFAFNGNITTLTVNGNTVIHSGTIGSQSVAQANQLYLRTAGASVYNANTADLGVFSNYYGGGQISNIPEGGYGSLYTFGGYSNTSLSVQLYSVVNHNTSAPTRTLYFRMGNNLGFGNDWKTLLDNTNYSSYAVPLSGGVNLSNGLSFTGYNTPNAITVGSGDVNWSFGSYADGGAQYWMQVKYYGTNDDNRGFRIFNVNGSTIDFRVNGSGNGIFRGDVTAYSDARVKENIVTVDNALNKVLSLRGVYYNRIDTENNIRKIGVIAQETLPIIPEVVTKGNDEMYTVAYGNMVGLLIEAIKEQQTQIESQKSEIDELKDLVKQLINR